MATPVFCCGFECGQIGSSYPHWRSVAGLGTIAIDTGTVRSGARSGKVSCSNQNVRIQSNSLGNSSRWVGRVYIRFATLPNQNTYLICSDTGGGASVGIAFKQSDSKLYCASGSTPTFGATGVSVTTGVWYRIDFNFDTTTGAGTADGQVDGTSLAQKTSASTDGDRGFSWGLIASNTTGELYADDWIISNTAGDYPFGAGYVNHFVPTSDGTHSTGSAGNFKVGSAGANITDATTDSYTLIDEVPLDDTTPDTNDYINAAADTGAGSNYVEHIFGAAPGISTPTIAPRAVEVIVAYHQANTGTGDSTFKLNDNGTENTIVALNAAGVTTTRYSRKHYATAPTGGAWTLSGAGNFNNLRHRFGYSTDGNPDQYFDCAMIEAEFEPILNYTLTANEQSLALTGQSVDLNAPYRLTVDVGSYTETGVDPSLKYGRAILPDVGVFTETGVDPLLEFSGNAIITANEGTLNLTGQEATLRFGYTLTATEGSLAFTGQNAALSGASNVVANAGTLALTGQSATLRYGRKLTATAGALNFYALGVELLAPVSEIFYLNLLIDLLPDSPSGNYQRFSEYLSVDGTELKVKAWSFEESEQTIAGALSIELANIAQRSLVTRDADIDFSLLKWNTVAVDWDWTTLLSTGYLDKSEYALSRQGIGTLGTFTFTGLNEMTSRLNQVPNVNLIYYNSFRHSVTADDFEGIYDADHNYTAPTVTSLGNMTLYGLLDEVFVNQCGFGQVRTNIPDFTLGIVQFPVGKPYIQTINGIIGMFEPDYSWEDMGGGTMRLWIRDGTSGQPPSFPPPRQVTCSQATALGVASDFKRIDALEIQVAQERYTFDSYSDRVVQTINTVGDLPPFPDLYVEITIDTTYRDWFRDSHPTKPVKTEVRHEVRTSRQNGLTIILRETEDYTYDSMGRLTTRIKYTEALVPDPTDSFAYNLIDVLEEEEHITYRNHPFEPRQYYIAQRDINVSGLIYIDSDNQILGQDYSQSAIKANLAGNVFDTMASDWVKISSIQEIITPQRGDKVKIETTTNDYLVQPNGHSEYRQEIRDGEIGVNIFIVEQQKIYLFAEGQTEITGFTASVNMGELPLNTAIALGERILKNNKSLPNIVSFNLIGIDPTLQKGTVINARGLNGEDLGTYIIEGRRMSGNRQDNTPVYFMSITCRQIEE